MTTFCHCPVTTVDLLGIVSKVCLFICSSMHPLVALFPSFMVSHVNSYSIYAVLVLYKLTYNYLEIFWFIFLKKWGQAEVSCIRFHALLVHQYLTRMPSLSYMFNTLNGFCGRMCAYILSYLSVRPFNTKNKNPYKNHPEPFISLQMYRYHKRDEPWVWTNVFYV